MEDIAINEKLQRKLVYLKGDEINGGYFKGCIYWMDDKQLKFNNITENKKKDKCEIEMFEKILQINTQILSEKQKNNSNYSNNNNNNKERKVNKVIHLNVSDNNNVNNVNYIDIINDINNNSITINRTLILTQNYKNPNVLNQLNSDCQNLMDSIQDSGIQHRLTKFFEQ